MREDVADNGKRCNARLGNTPATTWDIQMAGPVLPFLTLNAYRDAQARRHRDWASRSRRAEELGIPDEQLRVWRREQVNEQLRTARYRARVGAPARPGPRLLTPSCWQIGETHDGS